MHSRMETFPMPLDDLLLNWSFISEFVQKNWSSAKDKRDFFPQSLSIVDCYADTHKNILASGSAWKKCIFPLKVATEISFVFFFLIDLRQNGMWTHTHASSIGNFFYCVPLSLSLSPKNVFQELRYVVFKRTTHESQIHLNSSEFHTLVECESVVDQDRTRLERDT